TSKITGRGGCAKYCGTAPSPGNISFSSFRQSFTSNVNYLKRSLSSRFSSGDLSSELDDEPSTDSGLASMARDSSQSYQGVPERPLQTQPTSVPPSQPPVPGAPPPGPPQPVGGDLSLNLRPGSRTTSAPSSPAKTRESLLQRVQSLTGAARDQVGQGASILGAAVTGAARGPAYNKDRCFTLLVIDDQNTDWSKYFRGRRLHGDYEIRVEQAEFRELSLTASENGTVVSMTLGTSSK
ncbi:synapsin, partial [Ceratina calcarata]|uniref:Synapsin n=1 Tax=Ceratina calcarata TaxID=156304 RepID=A0AAJ7S9Q4_9HYME